MGIIEAEIEKKKKRERVRRARSGSKDLLANRKLVHRP